MSIYKRYLLIILTFQTKNPLNFIYIPDFNSHLKRNLKEKEMFLEQGYTNPNIHEVSEWPCKLLADTYELKQ